MFEILCFPFTQQPFRLVYSPNPASLVFKPLLQGMPARSDMYRQFKSYMKKRISAELPEHRRIDPERVELKWSNRQGDVNVALNINGQSSRIRGAASDQSVDRRVSRSADRVTLLRVHGRKL